MNRDRIKESFGRGKVFIAYVTAGFPSVAETAEIMRLLVEQGVDIIELGYPFSDPTADGPVIQASSQAALDHGFQRSHYFSIIEQFRQSDNDTPIVVFGYCNPIFDYGLENFAGRVQDAGADAILVVDLPFEEQSDIRPIMEGRQLHLIQLIAPTTPDERARRILRNATGFVYQIAVRGVTGERKEMAASIKDHSRRLKAMTKIPIALGFGISAGDQIRGVISNVDGIVVGSAIVRAIDENRPHYRDALSRKVRELADAVHEKSA